MKHVDHPSRYDKARQIQRRMDEISQQEYLTEPLPTPIQSGWKREFQIRYDILPASEAAFYDRILPYVQNTMYGETREEMETLTTKGRRPFFSFWPINPAASELVIKKVHKLGFIGQNELDKLRLDKKLIAKYLEQRAPRWDEGQNPGRNRHSYLRNDRRNFLWWVKRPHAFAPVIRPHYLTTKVVENGDAIGEYERLRQWMREHHGWETLYGGYSWTGRTSDTEKARMIAAYDQRSLRDELNERGIQTPDDY